MTGRTRVLWVIAGLRRGGAERLLCGLAERLDPRFDVCVAHVHGPDAPLAGRLRAAGARVEDLGGRRTPSPGWAVRLGRLAAGWRPAVVHTHSPLPAAVTRLVAPGPAFVHTEHSPWPQHHPLTRMVNAATYVRNRRVLAVSAAVAVGCAQPVPGLGRWWPRIDVVHHGSDQPAVPADAGTRAVARARLGLDVSAPVVGSVANFETKKDHDTLLRAMADLTASGRYPGLRCVLVGFGPREAELRRRCAALALDGTVLFAGSRDDVPELLPAFDVFAHTPVHEGFGLAPLEAMAAGVPVVATAVDGIGEVLGDDPPGALVPPGDDAAVAKAVAALLDDPGRRAAAGTAGRSRAEAFSLDTAARSIERIYDEVAG